MAGRFKKRFDYREIVELARTTGLGDAGLGALIRGIYEYEISGAVAELPSAELNIIFILLKPRIDARAAAGASLDCGRADESLSAKRTAAV